MLSPSTAARDRGLKLDRYRHFGVPEYWVVDPEARTIEVWHFAQGASEPVAFATGDTLRWEPLPDGPTLDVSVDSVFAGC
ncbi:MAG: Uma2 family endonuclease [Longimicrobiales bacterium]